MSLEEELSSFQPWPAKIPSSLKGKFVISHDHEEILSAPPAPSDELDPTTIEELKSVQLVSECHDQGFCDVPENGVWGWFELCIIENDSAQTPRKKDGIELVWISHNNRLNKMNMAGWVLTPYITPRITAWLITGVSIQKTGKEFREDHDMFRLIEDGNAIAVRLCVRWPGWELWVRTGRLVIELGDKVKKPPLSYGLIASNITGMASVFQDINDTILDGSLQISGSKKEGVH
ncbi:uncharacterized protein RAG0_12167 [Rhynchosporium agropyri]|uniref:Uncharacterized protein n=1 Tax=Rhynchosporium agropyri TaxID=914238 RepID=A0A1E1L7J9_9HELO|nr:uncharacterized protein RAG0_12167 [Rhynchosporium agropyri]